VSLRGGVLHVLRACADKHVFGIHATWRVTSVAQVKMSRHRAALPFVDLAMHHDVPAVVARPTISVRSQQTRPQPASWRIRQIDDLRVDAFSQGTVATLSRAAFRAILRERSPRGIVEPCSARLARFGKLLGSHVTSVGSVVRGAAESDNLAVPRYFSTWVDGADVRIACTGG
jgi:hypothetical protein